MDIPADLNDAPCVKLGGRHWPVPLLAARQNRIVDPLILSLLPVFAEWQADRTSGLAKIGPAQYDALQEIAFQAILRGHPETKREQFLDLPITLPELIAAFSVIARQTGVFERGDAAPGEAGAGSGPPQTAVAPTGTPS